MRTKIIQIGNSKGIRIPRYILEESGLKGEIEIEIKDKKIILKSSSGLREGWETAFQKMSENKDDILLDKEYVEHESRWDKEEWSW